MRIEQTVEIHVKEIRDDSVVLEVRGVGEPGEEWSLPLCLAEGDTIQATLNGTMREVLTSYAKNRLSL